MTINVLELASEKVQVKKVTLTEYSSPCPGCGEGTDRFRIWPGQGDNGKYWCRQCGKSGDNIQFLRDFEGLSFRDACQKLSLDEKINQDTGHQTPKVSPSRAGVAQQPYTPREDARPPDLWQEKASALVDWSHETLLNNPEQLDWLAARGIHLDAVKKFRLGFNSGRKNKDLFRPRQTWGLPDVIKKDGRKKKLWIPRGLVIPMYYNERLLRIRIRRRQEDDPPRYYIIPGSSMATLVITESGTDLRAVVVVESELDAVMLAQKAGDLAVIIALGSASTRPDAVACGYLETAAVILYALDYDSAGDKALTWWQDNFPRTTSWPTPQGNDPGEAYQTGVDIRAWITAGLPPAWSDGRFSSVQQKKPTKNLTGPTAGSLPDIDGLAELAKLLKAHPVSVACSTGKTAIHQSRKWEKTHPAESRRISELVFGYPGIFRFLIEHPAGIITGRNIFTDDK